MSTAPTRRSHGSNKTNPSSLRCLIAKITTGPERTNKVIIKLPFVYKYTKMRKKRYILVELKLCSSKEVVFNCFRIKIPSLS